MLPQGFRLPSDLSLDGYQGRGRSESCRKTGGFSYTTVAPGNIGNGVCSHCGLTALKDQNAEDRYIQHIRFS